MSATPPKTPVVTTATLNGSQQAHARASARTPVREPLHTRRVGQTLVIDNKTRVTTPRARSFLFACARGDGRERPVWPFGQKGAASTRARCASERPSSQG